MTAKPRFDGEWVRLGELCNICSGGTPKRSVAEYWNNGTIPWVKISDISSKYVAETEERITEAGLNGSSAKMLDSGTLLYSIFASIGAVGILEIPAATNQAIAALSIETASVNRDYLYHFLKSREALAKSTGRGAAQNNINLTILREMMVPVPPAVVQGQIVEQFEAVLKQIESAKARQELLDTLVKSRFVEMFGDVKYSLVMASEIMGSFRNGVSPSKNGGVHSKVLTLSAITQGKFDSSAWKDGAFKEEPPADKRVSDRDFYICRGNGNKELVGTAAFADRDYPDLVFPDTMIAGVIDDARIDRVYLSSAWAQPVVRSQIESKARTTNGTFKINQEIVASVRISLPPLALQQEFAAFVAEVDKSRFIVQQQLEKLQTLYDSLAQEYFS